MHILGLTLSLESRKVAGDGVNLTHFYAIAWVSVEENGLERKIPISQEEFKKLARMLNRVEAATRQIVKDR